MAVFTFPGRSREHTIYYDLACGLTISGDIPALHLHEATIILTSRELHLSPLSSFQHMGASSRIQKEKKCSIVLTHLYYSLWYLQLRSPLVVEIRLRQIPPRLSPQGTVKAAKAAWKPRSSHSQIQHRDLPSDILVRGLRTHLSLAASNSSAAMIT